MPVDAQPSRSQCRDEVPFVGSGVHSYTRLVERPDEKRHARVDCTRIVQRKYPRRAAHARRAQGRLVGRVSVHDAHCIPASHVGTDPGADQDRRPGRGEPPGQHKRGRSRANNYGVSPLTQQHPGGESGPEDRRDRLQHCENGRQRREVHRDAKWSRP